MRMDEETSQKGEKLTGKFVNNYPIQALIVSLSGTAFSGYMSYLKYFQEMCLFEESCPEFLGKPACFFGFAMFLMLLLSSLRGVIFAESPKKVNFLVSGVGTIFSGYFVLEELFTKGVFGKLGLSVCSWGFIMFTLMLFLSWREISATRKPQL